MQAEAYQVLNDVEHCLKRPDMVIGSVDPVETPYFAVVPTDDGRHELTPRSARVPPALANLFGEITANAVDQAGRTKEVKSIRVTTDAETGRITVWNDGPSIPVRMHRQLTDKHLTTVIFSQFRCGSNFDDTKTRKEVGRNGYGAKVVNAWSNEFTVEHHDGERHFTQTWRRNMAEPQPPKVTKRARKQTFTKVSFVLDYPRLGITDISGAMAFVDSLVWHLCPVTDPKVAVWLNNARLPIRSLKDYAAVLSPTGVAVYDAGTQIEVAVCPARPELGAVIGFVNGMQCSAGTHINFAMSRVKEALGVAECTMGQLRANSLLLVNATVTNPTFTSQTKEQLSRDVRKAGLRWEPSARFRTALRKSPVHEAVRLEKELRDTHRAAVAAKGGSGSKAGGRRHVSVPDYEPARAAGRTKRATPCSLILTEGQSAKSFAVAGVSVVGREHYGIYPLRGKLRNVRDLKLSTLLQTQEIANVLKILGVDPTSKARPRETAALRYDRVVVLADQDLDGSHICALVINMLQVLLPELVEANPDFVQRFSTPLIRAWPSNRRDAGREFMSELEFDSWWAGLDAGAQARHQVKYFKGLGTSTAREAKQCFQSRAKYLVSIDCTGEAPAEALRECFAGDCVDHRRVRMERELSTAAIDYGADRVPLEAFLEHELTPFWRYDNERSIPHAVDGLKPAQRKVLWTLLQKHPRVTEPTLKVAQLSGKVAEFTGYKHGEESLNDTIVHMAQDHPISGQNLNLLVPGGNFGSRHGLAASSPRYIYTCLEGIAHAVYPAADLPVLPPQHAEGQEIEPKHLVPVIPMAICNHSAGIGTGYASEVPAHHPATVLAWCRWYNRGEEGPEPALLPWLEGFGGGAAVPLGDGRWRFEPVLEQVGSRRVRVTDLPVPTDQFQVSAERRKKDAKLLEQWPHITEINSTDSTVDLTLVFEADVTPALLKRLRDRGALTVSSNNMRLWRGGGDGAPHRFETATEVARQHAAARLEANASRKAHRLGELDGVIQRATDEHRFVERVIERPEFLFRRPRAEVVADLASDGFAAVDGGYDHLLRIPFAAATEERLAKLARERAAAETEHTELAALTVHDLWERDLAALETAYAEFCSVRGSRRTDPDDPDAGTVIAKGRPTKRQKRV